MDDCLGTCVQRLDFSESPKLQHQSVGGKYRVLKHEADMFPSSPSGTNTFPWWKVYDTQVEKLQGMSHSFIGEQGGDNKRKLGSEL